MQDEQRLDSARAKIDPFGQKGCRSLGERPNRKAMKRTYTLDVLPAESSGEQGERERDRGRGREVAEGQTRVFNNSSRFLCKIGAVSIE